MICCAKKRSVRQTGSLSEELPATSRVNSKSELTTSIKDIIKRLQPNTLTPLSQKKNFPARFSSLKSEPFHSLAQYLLLSAPFALFQLCSFFVN